jgi:hypothetical protein
MFNFSLRSQSRKDAANDPNQSRRTRNQDEENARSNNQRNASRQNYENDNYNDYDYNEEISSADIFPTEKEKTGILTFFSEMRRESAFCDISFTCQGVLLRAHKVVVSAWSRWLRSLLLEGTDDEALSLDIFEPNALSSVIDYMYGLPLYIDVDTADDLLKVIRRLELQDLEQQCWRFLISAMNEDNCNQLHDLADRYDCPPLKLAAFRMLQETDPTYSFEPINFDINRAKENFNDGMKVRSGLTGPGERSFYVMSGGYEDYEDEEDVGALSVLDFARNMNDGDTDEDGDQQDGANPDEPRQRSRSKRITSTVFPEQLPPNASAAEVVRAWGTKLQYVYEQCLPADRGQMRTNENEDDEQDDDYRMRSMPPVAPSTIRFNYTRAPPSRRMQSSMLDDARRRGPAGLDWKNELKRFYLAIKMPEKLASIDDILKTWEGKEDQMLAAMIVKYKKLMPRSLLEHFDNLQSVLETQTESSFVHANAAAASFRQPAKSASAASRDPKSLPI